MPHAPLPDTAAWIEGLELCHHKAERHVERVVAAIGGYQLVNTDGGSAQAACRSWRDAIRILSSWLDDTEEAAATLAIGPYSAPELQALLGPRTPLTVWQVHQVIRKLQDASRLYPNTRYVEMVDFPEQYAADRAFRDATVQTRIHETGNPTHTLSLGTAIDHLQPCNWQFAENFAIVLRAIGGQCETPIPFAAHSHHLRRNPIGARLRVIAATLAVFYGDMPDGHVDEQVLAMLGQPTAEKIRLAVALRAKLVEAFGG